jgi:hypothetical protein
VESLQSHMILTMFKWTNLFASRHKGHRFKSPGGYLCETGILLLALSRYNRFNAGTEKSESTSCHSVLGPIYVVCAYLAHISDDTDPLEGQYI